MQEEQGHFVAQIRLWCLAHTQNTLRGTVNELLNPLDTLIQRSESGSKLVPTASIILGLQDRLLQGGNYGFQFLHGLVWITWNLLTLIVDLCVAALCSTNALELNVLLLGPWPRMTLNHPSGTSTVVHPQRDLTKTQHQIFTPQPHWRLCNVCCLSMNLGKNSETSSCCHPHRGLPTANLLHEEQLMTPSETWPLSSWCQTLSPSPCLWVRKCTTGWRFCTMLCQFPWPNKPKMGSGNFCNPLSDWQGTVSRAIFAPKMHHDHPHKICHEPNQTPLSSPPNCGAPHAARTEAQEQK